MQIGDQLFNAELEDILSKLRRQLQLNHIQYLEKEPKRSGKSLQIQCPYHSNGQERRRSAGIRTSDGMFHCFACNQIHTLPEVISYCFGHEDDVDGSFGYKWLVKNFATIEIEEREDIELDIDRTTRHSKTVNNTAVEFVKEKELEKYRWFHPYMYKRRLTDSIIEMFDIGYDKNTKCITFPVRDIKGRTLFIARRSVKYKFFQYPEGVEKPLYGLYELNLLEKYPDEIIVCESMLDALTCWVYGKYAVALNGLGNDLQFYQLKKLPVRKLILATDNDKRGMNARERIIKNVPNKIITQYVIPSIKRENGKFTKDINDLEKNEFDNLKEIF